MGYLGPRVRAAVWVGFLGRGREGLNGPAGETASGDRQGGAAGDRQALTWPRSPEIEPSPPGLGSHPSWIFGSGGRPKSNVKIGGFAVARSKGSRNVLVRLDYDDIGRLAGGIAGSMRGWQGSSLASR